MKKFLIIFSCLTFLGCGSATSEPQTIAQLLEEIEGEELSATQVSDLVEKAQIICKLSPNIQTEIWKNLDSSQFQFQDFVFDNQCPENKEFYTQETGRLKSTPQ